MDFKEFSVNTRKAREKKGSTFKVRNSVGVYDIYKTIRKNGWDGIGKSVPSNEFYAIIRGVNKLLAKELSEGGVVHFPYGLGRLELRKRQNEAKFVDGKLKVFYPVDWYSTLRLWFEDPEARASKTLVRVQNKDRFDIKYNKYGNNFPNKAYYDFAPNRFLKIALKNNIKAGKVDSMYY